MKFISHFEDYSIYSQYLWVFKELLKVPKRVCSGLLKNKSSWMEFNQYKKAHEVNWLILTIMEG